MSIKYRNFKKIAEAIDKPFFVQEKKEPLHVYLVNQIEWGRTEYNQKVNCEILKFKEEEKELVYWRENNPIILPIEKHLLNSLFITD